MSPVTCAFYAAGSGAVAIRPVGLLYTSPAVIHKLAPSTPVGNVGHRVCTDHTTGAMAQAFLPYAGTAPALAPAPVVTPQMLAQRAAAELAVSPPVPATSPGLDRFQLVGLKTWLWLQRWDTVARTASIPGLTATVSARPLRSTWDFGTAGKVVCDGPGTPYDLHRTATEQSTDCALTFTRSGTYTARVTVDWAVSWAANTGAAGTLPPIARTTVFPIEARAAQAVTD